MDNEQYLDQIEKIHGLSSLAELEESLIQLLDSMSFRWVHFCNVYDPDRGVDFYAHIGRMPAPLMDTYVKDELYKTDALHKIASERTGVVPVEWPDFNLDPGLTAGEQGTYEQGARHGVQDGISFPIHVGRTIKFGISLIHNGSKDDLRQTTEQHLQSIWLLTHLYATRVVHDFPIEFFADAKTPLSKNATTILSQLAGGATTAEIASSMSLTVKGVEYNIGRSIGKLGVKNRTQAVVRAFDLGLIRATSSW